MRVDPKVTGKIDTSLMITHGNTSDFGSGTYGLFFILEKLLQQGRIIMLQMFFMVLTALMKTPETVMEYCL